MTSSGVRLEAVVADLYRRPLGEFTAAREALAKQLRSAGRKDDAAQVHALTKAPPAAHLVNRLFAEEGKRLAALLAAGESARASQRAAVSGKGGETLPKELARVRELVEALRQRAGEFAGEGGRAAARELLDRVGATLQALAFGVDDEAAQRGWLDRDLEPPGFEVMAALELASRTQQPLPRWPARRAEPSAKSRSAPTPSGARSGSPAPARKHNLALVRPTRAEVERGRRAAAARTAVEQARAAAAPLERAAKEGDAEALKKDVEAVAAETTAREARRRAELAARNAAQLRAKAERAAQELERAEVALRRLEEGD
jgi:hypothetical protein